MCGISGFVDFSGRRKAVELEKTVTRMADTLRHRGPDDKGAWVDENEGVAFGHRRLSIIDISTEGHQPMVSHDGRFVIVFNGEIYNFKDLRGDLESKGERFRSNSDTEVMLAAVCRYGVDAAVGKFNGMFAFGLWDREDKILYLCRDRLGEKPLYYGFVNNSFVFASELKALKVFPGFNSDIDRDAITLFLRFNCIPAPHSIYSGIKKAMPGGILKFNTKAGTVETQAYWSAYGAAGSGSGRISVDPEQILKEAETLLRDAVKIRMQSDVPLGVFLSGGIDSSLITALMQAQSSVPVRTFTIGSGDSRYDESESARGVASYLGTSHTSLHVSSADALNVIPELPRVYDEPFADSSQIPTILVSRMARQHVTVCLSGDGGDEVFAGYNRYIWLERIWRRIRKVPYGVRGPLARILLSGSSDTFERIFEKTKFLLPGALRLRNPGIKFQKFADCLSAPDVEAAYVNLTSHWKDPGKVVLNPAAGFAGPDYAPPAEISADIKRRMMYGDMINYLPNDILVKVDRASMSASLESRAVYLDHRLVEYAWKLPVNMLIDGTGSKLILRNILKKYLPAHFWDRPKMGFAVPIDAWLRGPLRNWADDLLSGGFLKRTGFFDHAIVEKKWREHINGSRNWQFELWDILMFNSWLEYNR